MAAIPVDNQLDLQLFALLNLVAEPIAGDITPSAANVGRVYRNTSTGALMFCDSSSTVKRVVLGGTIGDADVAAGAAIQLSKLAVNPLARANHTGTQLSSTISDFAATVLAFRLDQLAAPTASINFNGQKGINQADGTANGDSATWGQVQNLVTANVNGQDWKQSARLAFETNVSVAAPGALSQTDALGTYTVVAGDRLVLANQTTAGQEGIWVYNGSGVAMTRATDADANVEVTSGMTVPIERGTRANTHALVTTPDPITVGTTKLAFTFLGAAGTYSGSTYINVSGGVISLVAPLPLAAGGVGVDASTAGGKTTARGNLGVAKAGFAADLGAIAAGGSVDVVHGLGTEDFVAQVFEKATGRVRPFLDIVHKPGAATTTVTVSSSVAWSASTLRLVVNPVVA